MKEMDFEKENRPIHCVAPPAAECNQTGGRRRRLARKSIVAHSLSKNVLVSSSVGPVVSGANLKFKISTMLKYQVRTLGRERQRQSTVPLRDVFTTNSQSDTDSGNTTVSGSISAPQSPWRDLSRCRGRSTSVSSLSSASTSSAESAQEWATIRVYTSSVRPDTDYKTLFVNGHTTAIELIGLVLNKFRSHFKDAELFYLLMELSTKHEANDVLHAVVLESTAKPLALQACCRSDRCRFTLRVKESFPVRIFYDSAISTTSNYKTLMISQWTTCSEAIRMLVKTRAIALSSRPIKEYERDEESIDALDFGLVLIDFKTRKETILRPMERIFDALCECCSGDQYQIHVRPIRRFRFPNESDDISNVTERFKRHRILPSHSEKELSGHTLRSRFYDHVL